MISCLGGPQAGILVGKKNLINKIKRHPLARAIRPDKLCLAGIGETLMHYLKDEAEKEIPVWQMMSKSLEDIKMVAESWTHELQTGDVISSFSTIGGGSLPEETLSTFVYAIKVKNPTGFLKKLRKLNFPIIARVENDLIILDPRTVFPEQYKFVLSGLKTFLK